MIRSAPRCFTRPVCLRQIPSLRRNLSTAPPKAKSRSWKSLSVRWGLACGLLYWYSTSNIFAEEASFPIANPHNNPPDDSTLPTIESIRAARRQSHNSTPPDTTAAPNPPSSPNPAESADSTTSDTLENQEEEAAQQGAFNEETGEINWDCPCLGGMAHGPCGEQFRAAFSCFVHSKEEPKGMECIDQFKTMQDCFRQHPDIYGSEADDEEVESELAPDQEAKASDSEDATARAQAATQQAKADHESESDTLVPKAAHDAR